MSNKLAIIIILFLSIATRFIFFGHPNQVVFDEVHFGKFISSYYTHQYYFDIHPPLGKMIIAGFGKLFDFKPEFSFANIGEKYPDNKYMALRFLPTMASVLLPLVIYFLALELGFSQFAAFAAGILISLENAILTQSRLILLDSFLLLFGFTALLFYFRYYNGRSVLNLAAAGIFGALAISIKWTGLTFLALPGLIELWTTIKYKSWPRLNWDFLFLLLTPLIIYFSVFAIHFALLPNSGEGDDFMSPGFQKTLKGNPNEKLINIKTPNLVNKFLELNEQMYLSNKRLTATHSYGSQWYTWPFMIRPIYYWVQDNSRIYLIGNPILWWLSTIGLIALIGLLIDGELRTSKITWIFLTAYILNLLPFIGIKRVMFLYHYLTALIFAILILVFLIDRTTQHSKKLLTGLILVSLAGFIYFAPLTYGLHLSPKAYEQRIWLQTWK